MKINAHKIKLWLLHLKKMTTLQCRFKHFYREKNVLHISGFGLPLTEPKLHHMWPAIHGYDVQEAQMQC